MATYNGHKNYNHWNISSWINNDEGLYRTAVRCVRSNGTKRKAAYQFIEEMRALQIKETPDGVRYSLTAVIAAMQGM